MRRAWIVLMLLGSAVVFLTLEQRAQARPHPVRVIRHAPMADLSDEKTVALRALNAIRMAMGMVLLKENSTLAQAARQHAGYLVRHHITSHFEEATRKGFTGAAPVDRALRAGYAARFVGENLSTGNPDASDSIGGLFSAIYHRFGFLNPSFDEVGIGIAQERNDPSNSAFVYLMGHHEIETLCRQKSYHGSGRYVYGICADTRLRIDAQLYDQARNSTKAANPGIILYPYDGQEDVPPVFYQEDPDPLPEYDVSGFPVSVEFNDRYFRKVTVLSFRLFEVGGDAVGPVRLLNKAHDPNHRLTRRQFALLPLKRLKYATQYRAELVYRHKQKRRTLTWSYTTRKPPEPLKVIRDDSVTLTLKSGRSYWLYFVPRNRHDVLGSMRFPEDIYVRFVDHNTMRIVLDPERTDAFDIRGSGRKVHIVLKP